MGRDGSRYVMMEVGGAKSKKSSDSSSCTPHCFSVPLSAFFFPPLSFSLCFRPGALFSPNQMHYDNPRLLSGVIDNSAYRLVYTPALRQHEGGFIMTGHSVVDIMAIPPNQKSWNIHGYCPGQCTQQLPQPLKMIGSILHAHLLGTGIRVDQIRNGKALPPLHDNPTYDFNYQSLEYLPAERTLLPGDSLRVTCTYRSDTDHITQLKSLGFNHPGDRVVTLGGESTLNEMCMVIILVYPRPGSISRCQSSTSGIDKTKLIGGRTWSSSELAAWTQEIQKDVSVCSRSLSLSNLENFVPYPTPARPCSQNASLAFCAARPPPGAEVPAASTTAVTTTATPPITTNNQTSSTPARRRRAIALSSSGMMGVPYGCESEPTTCRQTLTYRVDAAAAAVDIEATFRLVAPTGWVGVGFSNQGRQMAGADAVLAWWDYSSQAAIIRDVAISSYDGPVVESDQSDISNASLARVRDTVILKFRRQLAGSASANNLDLTQPFSFLLDAKGLLR